MAFGGEITALGETLIFIPHDQSRPRAAHPPAQPPRAGSGQI
jgi:hypothetical protein